MTSFDFVGELFAWDADAPDSWVFVALPPPVSDAVDEAVTAPPRGFGSVRVRVRVGETTWDTSLFPSKPLGTYVLPVRKSVRRAEGLEVGDAVTVSLVVRD